jgi:hypothetical protein
MRIFFPHWLKYVIRRGGAVIWNLNTTLTWLFYTNKENCKDSFEQCFYKWNINIIHSYRCGSSEIPECKNDCVSELRTQKYKDITVLVNYEHKSTKDITVLVNYEHKSTKDITVLVKYEYRVPKI